MHPQLIAHRDHSPYCGERTEALLGTSQGNPHAVEACSVYCRAIELQVDLNASSQQIKLTAHTDTE